MKIELFIPWLDERSIGYTVVVECNPWSEYDNDKAEYISKHVDKEDLDGAEVPVKTFEMMLAMNKDFAKLYRSELAFEIEKIRERAEEEDKNHEYD